MRAATLGFTPCGKLFLAAISNCKDTMAVHAAAALAQIVLDRVGDSLGAVLLETVWAAEFSILLRPGKFLHRRRTMAGESAHVLLASDWLAAVPISVHYRPGGSAREWPTPYWRHGIHVRSRHTAIRPVAQSVSHRHPSAAALGHLARGIRSTRMEVSDADHVDRDTDQLFLAARIQHKLGSRSLFSRAARGTRIGLSFSIFNFGSSFHLLSHALVSLVACAPPEIHAWLILGSRHAYFRSRTADSFGGYSIEPRKAEISSGAKSGNGNCFSCRHCSTFFTDTSVFSFSSPKSRPRYSV